MNNYPEQPRLELVDPHWYKLVEPYRYLWTHEGTRYRITVTADFHTDLASIPRPLWWMVDPQSLGLGPPLIHDVLYACRGHTIAYPWVVSERRCAGQWASTEDWSRYNTDRLFGRHMRQRGTARWKRRSAYWMVRAFGLYAWRGTRPGNLKYGETVSYELKT